MTGEIASGVNYEVFYYEEVTPGTIYGALVGQTTDYIALGVISSIKINHGKELIETKGLGFDHVSENSYGKETVSISMEGLLTVTAETFLINLMNASESYFSIIAVDNDLGGAPHYFWFTGMELSKIKFSASVGEQIKWSAELDGMSYQNSATDPLSAGQSGEYSDYAASFVAVAPTLWTASSISKVAASGWTNTGQVTEATSWEVEINYNVQVRHHMNNDTKPARVQRTGYNVKGKFSADFENTNHLAELITGNQGSIRIYTNSPTDSKSILVAGCRFESLDLDVKEWELIEMDVPFTGTIVTLDFTA